MTIQEDRVLKSVEDALDWLHNADYEVEDLLHQDCDARRDISRAIASMQSVKYELIGNRKKRG